MGKVNEAERERLDINRYNRMAANAAAVQEDEEVDPENPANLSFLCGYSLERPKGKQGVQCPAASIQASVPIAQPAPKPYSLPSPVSEPQNFKSIASQPLQSITGASSKGSRPASIKLLGGRATSSPIRSASQRRESGGFQSLGSTRASSATSRSQSRPSASTAGSRPAYASQQLGGSQPAGYNSMSIQLPSYNPVSIPTQHRSRQFAGSGWGHANIASQPLAGTNQNDQLHLPIDIALVEWQVARKKMFLDCMKQLFEIFEAGQI